MDKRKTSRKGQLHGNNGGWQFEIIKNFNYLGITITEEVKERLEMQESIVKLIRCMAVVGYVLSSQ